MCTITTLYVCSAYVCSAECQNASIHFTRRIVFVAESSCTASGTCIATDRNASQCRFKCEEVLTRDERQRLFDAFYALGEQRLRWQYHAVPKLKDQLIVTKRRQNNIRYFLYGSEEHDGESLPVFVCKTTFTATFDISEKLVAPHC